MRHVRVCCQFTSVTSERQLKCSPKNLQLDHQLSMIFIRQPDVVGTALRFTAVLSFFYQTPILRHHAAATYQMYTTGSVVEHTRYSHSAFSHTPPLIFYMGQKCEIWPRSSTPLFFDSPSFGNEATYRYQSFLFGAAMMQLCYPQIWCSLVHPPLRSRV